MRQIPLRARDGSIRAYALVDDEDYEWAMSLRWSLSSQGYVSRRDPDRYMHQDVAERQLARRLEHGELVHHDNENRLDNRRKNLIVASRPAHQRHHKLHTGRGYYWDRGRWRAIAGDGKGGRRNLGRYRTEAEAAEAVRRFREEQERWTLSHSGTR
jgi:hypothetical protein